MGTELDIPVAQIPVRTRHSSRGDWSSASIRSLKCVSKPCRIVGRSWAMRARMAGGSKVSVRIWRAPDPHGDLRSPGHPRPRSEEHTSELQSRPHLVCRLLLEKKKRTYNTHTEWRYQD